MSTFFAVRLRHQRKEGYELISVYTLIKTSP
jgi:hypothetical protein